MPKFELSSGRLIERLNQIKNEFSGKTTTARLSVAPEDSWWYFHEFGTATHFEPGGIDIPPSVKVTEPEDSLNSGGYDILPDQAKGIRLPITSGHPEALLVPQVGAEYTIQHPGVEALGLVRTVLPEIHALAATQVITALQESGYQFSAVQSAVLDKVMPEVLSTIVENIANLMPLENDRDTPGRLQGESASAAFAAGATITEVSGE